MRWEKFLCSKQTNRGSTRAWCVFATLSALKQTEFQTPVSYVPRSPTRHSTNSLCRSLRCPTCVPQVPGGTASMLWTQARPPVGSTCCAHRVPTVSCRRGASRPRPRAAGPSSRGDRTDRSTSSETGSSIR